MIPIEQCYGVITVYRAEKEDLFLLVQHEDIGGASIGGTWSFPKGHHEGNETPKETALRELWEETAIREVRLLETSLFYEEYEIKRNNEKRRKVNEYFIGFVNDKTVTIQADELHAYKWATYEEALQTFIYPSRKATLIKAKEYLDVHENKR